MNSLGWAAQRLIPELEYYGIKVYMTEWRITWGHVTIKLMPHTPRFICWLVLKRLIFRAKWTGVK